MNYVNFVTEKNLKIKKKIMSDVELRIFLKQIDVNVLKIDHSFDGNQVRACVTCNYVVRRCWLCDQCKCCCDWNVAKLV